MAARMEHRLYIPNLVVPKTTSEQQKRFESGELSIVEDGGIALGESQKIRLTKDGTRYEHTISLISLNYVKKMYQPCEIQAVVSVGTGNNPDTDINETEIPSYQGVVNGFHMQEVSMKIRHLTTDDRYDKEYKVARNYFIYSVKPIFTTVNNNTSIRVELGIFSPDKLMTIDKFSKAYTAKMLGEHILKGEIGNFKTGGIGIPYDISHLQLINTPNSKHNAPELRIPYAVQYNESFYSFLSRIANRYGEFLYFENGALHLGIDVRTDNYYKEAENIRTVSDGTMNVVKYQDIIDWAGNGTVSRRRYETILPQAVAVEDTYYSYMERKGNMPPFAGPGYHNSNPVPADEYLRSIAKDGYTSFEGQFKYYEKIILDEIFTILGGSALSDMVAGLLASVGFRLWRADIMTKNLNLANNNLNIDGWEESKVPDQRMGDDLSQFATLDKAIEEDDKLKKILGNDLNNLTNIFYSIVRKAEKDVSNKAVVLEMKDKIQDFMLGDKIRVDGTDYIIVEISGCSSDNDHPNGDSQTITAIPLYNYEGKTLPTPPALPDVIAREAKPQTAFVTGIMDPERLGRVRIRYPWQTGGDNDSPWIRIATPMNTDGGGVNFKPQMFDEAIVDYEEGNIDRPYVVGFVQTPFCKNSWGALPDRGIASKNGHTLSFNDPINGNGFFYNIWPGLQMIRGFFPNTVWPSNMSDNDKMLDLAGGFSISDRYGFYKITGSSDARMVTIQSPMGEVIMSAFTGIKIVAPNGDVTISGKNINLVAGNKINMTSGTSLRNRFVKSGSPLVGGFKLFAEDTLLGFMSSVSKQTADKLFDFTFLRTVLEVFLRPIDGTTKIKSTTFLCLEAGPGMTEIPYAAYKRAPKTVLTDAQKTAQQSGFNKFKNTIALINLNVDAVVNLFKDSYRELVREISSFNDISWEEGLNDDEGCISFDSIVNQAKREQDEKATLAENKFNWDAANFDEIKVPKKWEEEEGHTKPERKDYQDPNAYDKAISQWNTNVRKRNIDISIVKFDNAQIKRNGKKLIKERANNLLRSLIKMKLVADRDWSNRAIIYSNGTNAENVYTDVLNALQQMDLTYCPFNKQKAYDLEVLSNLYWWRNNNSWNLEKTILKRKLAYELLCVEEVKTLFRVKQTHKPDFSDAKSWATYVRTVYTDDSLNGRATDWAVSHYVNPLKVVKDDFRRRKMWNAQTQGQILFSDNPTKTINFARNGMDERPNIEQVSTRYAAQIQRILNGI